MRNDNYPEKGEYVLGKVKNIFKQGAFIELEEYGHKKGMLHLSEISLKWVRNIRDYVKEGQKVVLAVLRVDPNRGHIDLSLRRVSDSARKKKLQDVKQKQRSKKLLELFSEEVGGDLAEIEKKVGTVLEVKYGSVYAGLEMILSDSKTVEDLDISTKWRESLVELITKSIKSPFVEITGYVELKSYDSEGGGMIKKSLSEIGKHTPNNCEISLSYVSAPLYSVKVKAPDYKTAEKALKKSVEQGIKYLESKHGDGIFHREMPKVK